MNTTRGLTIAVLLFVALSLRAEQADSLLLRVAELPGGAKEMTSLSFKDADLRDIFRALSQQHNLNIFVDNSIQVRTTVALRNVQVYEAMEFLCEQNNLVMDLRGGMFRISTRPTPKPEPPPPKIPMVYYEAGLLTVQLKNDDLEQTILEVQKKSGKNILLLSGTSGSLSGTLNDIEFDLGFTQLLNNNGFAVQKRNSIYLVSRLEYFVGQQSAQQPTRSGPYWISVKDSLVTMDVTNASLDRVVADVLRQLNTDVVFYNAPAGTVTVRATGIPLHRALDLVLRNSNFTYRETDGIYVIGDKANKALASTALLRLKHLRAEKALEIIPTSITSQATLKVLKEQNAIVAIAGNDVVTQVREFLDHIDRPVAQVLIEALVVDYDLTDGLDLGIDAGFGGSTDTTASQGVNMIIPGIDFTWNGTRLTRGLQQIGLANLGQLPSDFYLRLRALEQKGRANVRSRPILSTLNGHQATLSIGTTQYFILKTTTPYRDQTQVIFQESQNFQTIEADVRLEITPYVGADRTLTLEIKPDFKTPVGQLSPNVPPTINRRALSSTLVVKEGETIVLGGLIQETESELRTQTPILGSIPLLGYLFSSTSKSNRKSELIIYVTPHISYGEGFTNSGLPDRR
ncbi:MAG TPA: hypothetical protein DCP63_01245 [Bacteroidetes bacterium]|nr:hypothetical protein [Bacteroidota bacterium]